MAASTATVAVSSARHCTAMAPCPAWGSMIEWVEHVGQPGHPAQPLHGGHGDHDRADAAVLAPADPSFHVAPHLGEAEVGAQVGQLGPAPGRAGGDDPARRQVGQRAADQPVTGVGPRRDGRQHQMGRHDRGQVLGRVHGGVGPAVGHALLDLGDEDALPADGIERRATRRRPGSGPPPPRPRDRRGPLARTPATSSLWRRAKGEPRLARRKGGTADPKGRRGGAALRPGARRGACPPFPSRAWWARAASWPARPGWRRPPAPTRPRSGQPAGPGGAPARSRAATRAEPAGR